jgi:1-acyl-sn-glycerol-3-phosphate acyltransferase
VKLHYRLGWIAARALARLLWRFRSLWPERIPASGPVIVACNHVSNWDPIFVGLGCPREVHFLAKRELFKNPFLAWLIRSYNAIPVRRGVADRRGLRAAGRVLDANGVLVVFPEGTRSTTGELGQGRPGVAYLAEMTGARVVPACIVGSNELGPPLRSAGGLRVAYAEPLDPPDVGSRETNAEYTARVMDRIRQLKQEVSGS